MSRSELGRNILSAARRTFTANVENLTLDEALFSADGYRSILGVLKHAGGWGHVYRSYAFDAEPRHWNQTSWPRGLRDEVELSKEYVDEVIAWIGTAFEAWDADLATQTDLDTPRRLHWGATAPLLDIVILVANHFQYHTGELNMLLSIARGEAWEYSEEVEENHISTFGHGVRAVWMSDEHAKAHEEAMRAAYEARMARRGADAR